MGEPLVAQTDIAVAARNSTEELRVKAGKVHRTLCQISAPPEVIKAARAELIEIAALAFSIHALVPEPKAPDPAATLAEMLHAFVHRGVDQMSQPEHAEYFQSPEVRRALEAIERSRRP